MTIQKYSKLLILGYSLPRARNKASLPPEKTSGSSTGGRDLREGDKIAIFPLSPIIKISFEKRWYQIIINLSAH
jgi:hypothetical protein